VTVDSECGTVGAILVRAATSSPDALALVVPPDRLSYRQLHERALVTARGLAASGVAAGDRVGLLMPNGTEFVESLFAVALLGAVAVPVNPRLQPPEIAYVTEHAGTRLVLSADGHPGLADAAGAVEGSAVLAAGERVRPSDDALLLYTSGTTSKPKGVRLSHRAVVGTGTARFAQRADAGPPVVWTPCPFFHVGALVPLIGCIALGIPFVTQRQFDAGEALRLWEQERVTTALPLFPAFTDAILDDPSFAATDRARLQQVLSTGRPDQVERAQRALAPARLVSAYGMTELCGVAASSPLDESDDDRRTWDGRPFAGIELRIVDPVSRRPLPPGALGEIAARGLCRLTAYHRDPEATAAAIDADGWFHTGDLGIADATGRVAFQGRGRDILKVGGENVSPLEVEAHLSSHPAVAHVEVVGAPHPRLDECVAAFVELSPGAAVTEAELIDHCRGSIAHFKVPRHVRFVDPGAWPLSATKVSKAALRDRIGELHLPPPNGVAPGAPS
jgi:acyl-CoA synthetase (AMP-forming)/AMP-acid ligase II